MLIHFDIFLLLGNKLYVLKHKNNLPHFTLHKINISQPRNIESFVIEREVGMKLEEVIVSLLF